MHKDRYIAKKRNENLNEKIKEAFAADAMQKDSLVPTVRFLSMINNHLAFAMILRTCQGFPLEDADGGLMYPKMLLIDADFYKKQRDGKVNLEYSLIKNALQHACYVMTINGESAEKKMCFCLNDAGHFITLHMLDPNNGLSKFYVTKSPNKGNVVITADPKDCHPRGEYWCKETEKICMYCEGEHNCKHKSLNIAAAVLFCFQEYIRKTSEGKVLNADKAAGQTTKDNKKTESYIPSGMIRMYDIKYSKEELARINKYAMFGKTRSVYPSTEKKSPYKKGHNAI